MRSRRNSSRPRSSAPSASQPKTWRPTIGFCARWLQQSSLHEDSLLDARRLLLAARSTSIHNYAPAYGVSGRGCIMRAPDKYWLDAGPSRRRLRRACRLAHRQWPFDIGRSRWRCNRMARSRLAHLNADLAMAIAYGSIALSYSTLTSRIGLAVSGWS